MIKDIRWTEYIIFVSGLLAVYYLYVLLLYYRRELHLLLTGRLRMKRPPAEPTGNKEQNPRLIMDALDQLFSKAAANLFSRTDLINGLQETLSAYPSPGKAMRYALENYITRESKVQCSPHLIKKEGTKQKRANRIV